MQDNPKTDCLQVLIGFLTTAYLTLVLVVVYYLTGCIDAKLLNTIDNMVLTKLSPVKYLGSVQTLETTLRRMVLMFSDQQAVTGIALLASGYAQLGSGIVSYHWQILVYLVWFSSLTHLTTLTILRQYFNDNQHARAWRAILMFITVVMLGVALVPTGDTEWFTNPEADINDFSAASMPAICYFRRWNSQASTKQLNLGSLATISMIISIVVLASGYLTRIVKFSSHVTTFSRTWLEDKPSECVRRARDCAARNLEKHALGPVEVIWIMIYIALETTYVWCKAMSDVYMSIIWEVRVLILTLNLRHSRRPRSEYSTDSMARVRPGLGNPQPVRSSKYPYRQCRKYMGIWTDVPCPTVGVTPIEHCGDV